MTSYNLFNYEIFKNKIISYNKIGPALWLGSLVKLRIHPSMIIAPYKRTRWLNSSSIHIFLTKPLSTLRLKSNGSHIFLD